MQHRSKKTTNIYYIVKQLQVLILQLDHNQTCIKQSEKCKIERYNVTHYIMWYYTVQILDTKFPIAD